MNGLPRSAHVSRTIIASTDRWMGFPRGNVAMVERGLRKNGGPSAHGALPSPRKLRETFCHAFNSSAVYAAR